MSIWRWRQKENLQNANWKLLRMGLVLKAVFLIRHSEIRVSSCPLLFISEWFYRYCVTYSSISIVADYVGHFLSNRWKLKNYSSQRYDPSNNWPMSQFILFMADFLTYDKCCRYIWNQKGRSFPRMSFPWLINASSPPVDIPSLSDS